MIEYRMIYLVFFEMFSRLLYRYNIIIEYWNVLKYGYHDVSWFADVVLKNFESWFLWWLYRVFERVCYTYNSFSMILMTFCALLMIIFFVVKIVKDFEKVVFVSRFDFNFIKKIVYFFVAFLCVEIKVFVDFFLNKEFMSFLIILLSIVLKINEWFSLFVSSTSSYVWFLTIFSKRWSNWFDEKINSSVSRMLIIIDALIYVFNGILMLISLTFLLMRFLFDEI